MGAPDADAVARAQIEQTISRIYGWTDGRQSSRIGEVLADDFHIVTPESTMNRDEYVARMTAREQAPYDTRHVWTNLQLTVDGDSAHGRYYQCAHVRQPGEAPTSEIQDVEDHWVRRDGHWLLTERRRFPAFD